MTAAQRNVCNLDLPQSSIGRKINTGAPLQVFTSVM